jgi:hypothetical protein
MIDKVIPLPRRPIDDAKMAHAFMELEPYLLSLERAAKIARHFFLEDPDEEELELGLCRRSVSEVSERLSAAIFREMGRGSTANLTNKVPGRQPLARRSLGLQRRAGWLGLRTRAFSFIWVLQILQILQKAPFRRDRSL